MSCPASLLIRACFAAALAAGRISPAAAQNTDGPVRVDSLIARAEQALQSGHPWRATTLLAPLVRIPAARSPRAVRIAAEAAAAWRGWGSVIRLLEGESWLDSADDGAGRALLAHAYLERRQLEPALRDARRAVALRPDGTRRLTLARVLDRLDQLDSAAVQYVAALSDLPEIADWLRLRAAGVTRDSALRQALYAGVHAPAAVARIRWTEARARERTGDRLGAARLYDALGEKVTRIRLWLESGDPDLRLAARASLNGLLAPGLGSDDAREAIRLFDQAFTDRTPEEELRMARRAAIAGELERASQGFDRAGARRLTDRDRLTWANLLTRLGRYDLALPVFAAVKGPELRGEAAYQRARAILRSGESARAIRELGRVAQRFANDRDAAATALFLTGDLLIDRDGDDSARAVFRQAMTRYPTTRFGRRAGFQAAMIAYLNDDYATAAKEFDALGRGSPSDDETLAGLYWAGRALEAVGDSSGAAERWRSVLTRGPDGYYATRAAGRLGTSLWEFADSEAGPRPAGVPEPLRRAARLSALDLRAEARFETAAFIESAQARGADIRTAAHALARVNQTGRAMRLAMRAPSSGRDDRELAELLHPLPFREVLAAEADRAGLDPFLVAALIRQESAFDPEARSAADARGLMQVLPSVGAGYARDLGLPEWDPVLLYQPDVNLHFGITHLAEGLARFPVVEQALAAFNAGVSRVEQWLSMRGAGDDPEVFVERIPFAETRDYVRRVLRNLAVYHALYGADQTGAT